MNKSNLSPDNIERLTHIHLHRYGNRLKDAHKHPQNYNVNELKWYLSLWEEIESRDYNYYAVSESAQQEIMDAINGEE